MSWANLTSKYNIIKNIRLFNEFKTTKKIYCNKLNEFDNIKKNYISQNFYTKWCAFDPYYGPSSDYDFINPLWICRNILNNNCHPGFGCLCCKQSGLKIINN